MSGLTYPKKSTKSGDYRRVRPRLFTSAHEVSVVILWSERYPPDAKREATKEEA
jgi:hypothetical protein